ncbi:MAG: molybdopterin cofactor-binding domain-containing protein [Terriglobia bacterium]
MSSKPDEQFVIEPERYELSAPLPYHFELDRREFFRVLGGGVAVFLLLPRELASQESGGGRGSRESQPKELAAWLHIGEDGAVTVFTGKAELGQNIRTSLTQAVAEELRAPVDSIRLVMGDTDLTPFEMGTFGSRTTPFMAPVLRRAAAAARNVLVELAAKQWNIDAAKLVASDGKVTDPASGHSIEYRELAKGQALAKAVVGEPSLTPAADWKVAGKPLGKINGAEFVTGKHRFTPDTKLEGMLHGKILRAPSFGATLASIDASAAQAIPGVTVVHDGNFVGVTAKSQQEATRAVAAARAQWKPSPQVSQPELFDYLKKNARPGEGRHETGSVESALAQVAQKLEAIYTVQYIAHAPLEPRAAVAVWKDGKLTVWTGTQRPFGVRDELMEAFRLDPDRVRVIVPDTGAAYGGKHTGDAAIEAARLARAAGKPVKVVWTREEEFTWAYFRPAGVIEVRGGARADGTLVAWEFHNYNSGGAAIRTPYDIPNQRIEFHPVDSPLRQGSYRALAATANFFARESHMDELAHAVKMDPFRFRLKNLKDERLRAVFEAAAKAFGWQRTRRSPDQGFGIGGGIEKNGYVATCVEVAVNRSTGTIKVVRVVTAFDCGPVVNPDGLKNQIVGANIMGLGGALFEEIKFENGRILNNHFAQYRVPRFSDVPPIEVVLVDRKDLPSSGAGETPMLGLAPAIGNAIFDATGVRLRALPMLPEGRLPKV